MNGMRVQYFGPCSNRLCENKAHEGQCGILDIDVECSNSGPKLISLFLCSPCITKLSDRITRGN